MSKINSLHILFSDLLTLLFLVIIRESITLADPTMNRILLLLLVIISLKLLLLIIVEGFYFYNMRLNITQDALTKVYNRGSLDRMLPVMFEKSRKANKPFCVIMADIDHFKKINDEYDHSAGDLVLKSFAALIKSNIRAGLEDVFRYGGEEFTICLKNTTLEEGLAVAERLRNLVMKTPFTHECKDIFITSSFGIAQASEDTKCFKELLKLADISLYEAKNTGRNKCVAVQGE